MKRIALAVVTALAGGLLAAAPAAAADTSGLFALTSAESTSNFVHVAGAGNYIKIATTESVTASNTIVKVAVSGAGATIDTATANVDSWSIAADKLSAKSASGLIWDSSTAYDTITILTPTAGTVTINVSTVKDNGNGTFTETAEGAITVTVNAAATAGIVSASESTSYIASGRALPNAADSSSVTAAYTAQTAAASAAATIRVSLKDANTSAASAKPTVTISGPGTLSLAAYSSAATDMVNAQGRALTGATAGAEWIVGVFGDGTAGVATITITAGAFTATEKVTFYGKIASLKATVKKAYVTNASTATSGAIQVVAYDKDGVVVPSAGVAATTSNTTTMPNANVEYTAAGKTASAAEVAAATYNVSAKGATDKTGKVTITFTSTDDDTIKTTADVTVANAVASTVALAWDKAEYAPGDKATVTVTLKDADGNPVADGAYVALTSAGIAYSANVGGASSNETVTTTSGVAKYTVYVPLAAGPLVASATTSSTSALKSAVQATAISASAKVVVAASAAETANAAAIATLNTAVATLQTTVASLVASMTAQIKVINSALVKIAKKLKVKI